MMKCENEDKEILLFLCHTAYFSLEVSTACLSALCPCKIFVSL